LRLGVSGSRKVEMKNDFAKKETYVGEKVFSTKTEKMEDEGGPRGGDDHKRRHVGVKKGDALRTRGIKPAAELGIIEKIMGCSGVWGRQGQGTDGH